MRSPLKLIKRFFSRPHPAPFYTRDHFKSPVIEVGEFTYGVPRIREWGEGSRLIIGKFCSIADNVQILLGGNHRTDWVTTYPFPALPEYWPDAKHISGHPLSRGDVVIGNDVWIGTGTTVLSGVHIGDGAVIGACSVVSGDVEPYSILVGNPARLVRKRFSENQIEALLRIQWWNWPIEEILCHLPLLCSEKVNELMSAIESAPKKTDFRANLKQITDYGPDVLEHFEVTPKHEK